MNTVYVYAERDGHSRRLLGIFHTLADAIAATDTYAEDGDIIETWETGKVDEPSETVAERISGKWIT